MSRTLSDADGPGTVGDSSMVEGRPEAPGTRVAVITGGSSGLGLAMARQLCGEGFVPVILARSQERLEAAQGELRHLQPRALALRCDVTRPEDVEAAAGEIRRRFGKIHYLILNAGVVHVGLIEDAPDLSTLKADIETDLWGSLLSARFFVPMMAEGGRLLLVSSGYGLMGAAGYGPYGAAKAGLVNLAACLRRELMHRRISVHVACPGNIDTPQYREEMASMPDWMAGGVGSGKPMSPEAAASRILRRARGNRLLVVINWDLRALLFFRRFLPAGLMELILDRAAPRPG